MPTCLHWSACTLTHTSCLRGNGCGVFQFVLQADTEANTCSSNRYHSHTPAVKSQMNQLTTPNFNKLTLIHQLYVLKSEYRSVNIYNYCINETVVLCAHIQTNMDVCSSGLTFNFFNHGWYRGHKGVHSRERPIKTETALLSCVSLTSAHSSPSGLDK